MSLYPAIITVGT